MTSAGGRMSSRYAAKAITPASTANAKVPIVKTTATEVSSTPKSFDHPQDHVPLTSVPSTTAIRTAKKTRAILPRGVSQLAATHPRKARNIPYPNFRWRDGGLIRTCRHIEGGFGCGGRIRTDDLRVI